MLKAGGETTVWSRREAQQQEEEAWKKLAAMPDFHVVRISEQERKRWYEAGMEPQKEAYAKRVGKDTADKVLGRTETLRK